MTKIDLIAKEVVSKRTKKSARIKQMLPDLVSLRVEKGLTYREIAEVFSRATEETVSENYIYQQIRHAVEEAEANKLAAAREKQ